MLSWGSVVWTTIVFWLFLLWYSSIEFGNLDFPPLQSVLRRPSLCTSEYSLRQKNPDGSWEYSSNFTTFYTCLICISWYKTLFLFVCLFFSTANAKNTWKAELWKQENVFLRLSFIKKKESNTVPLRVLSFA